MSTPDFRDQEPTWVVYAECTTAQHDKFYEMRVDLGDDGIFYLTKRWGARPDRGAGQIKVETFAHLKNAMGAAQLQLAAKVRKGYVPCTRPAGASNKVSKEYGNDYYSDEEAF